MPRVEWTKSRLRYFPVVLPLVGIVVGLMGMGFFASLLCWKVSPVLRGVLMALFYLCLTGGLHMDGFMDTCDAVFSRQDRENRLRILSDAHSGAFAVMGCVVVSLLKAGIFSELFETYFPYPEMSVLVVLTMIPVYSRIGLGMLFYLPFAREDGLARTLGGARVSRDRLVLAFVYVFLSVCAVFSLGLKWAVIPLVSGVFFWRYAFYCVKIFGGTTGDLMGAFVEISETSMLLALAVMKR
jgi:adenosylcobinamide-GDP ribazoletransferase